MSYNFIMNVIYRKYRPRSFSEVIGHDIIVSLLKKSVINNKLHHAYLLSGPRGTGKTSLARILAKAANCLNFRLFGDVCNKCENCLSIDKGNNSDFIELDAASNRKVEDIRNLLETITYLPNNLKKKVIILDEVHMLIQESFNTLLKTLEEPPDYIIFILATTDVHKVPITILSRVQRLDLNLATESAVTQKLSNILEQENIQYDLNALTFIHKLTGGSFRDAESLLSKCLSINEKKLDLDSVYSAIGYKSYDIYKEFIYKLIFEPHQIDFKDISENLNQNINEYYFIDNTLEILRDLLYNHYTNSRKLSDIEKERLFFAISKIIHLKEILKGFTNKYLLIEVTFYQIIENFKASTQITSKKSELVELLQNESHQTNKPEIENKEIDNKNIQNTNSDLKTLFLEKIRQESERIYMLFSVISFEITDNKLLIFNADEASKFSLETKPTKKCIQNVLNSLGIGNITTYFSEDDNAGTQENIKNNTNHVNVDTATKVENIQETNLLSVAQNITISEDNSDLIEAIFKDI